MDNRVFFKISHGACIAGPAMGGKYGGRTAFTVFQVSPAPSASLNWTSQK